MFSCSTLHSEGSRVLDGARYVDVAYLDATPWKKEDKSIAFPRNSTLHLHRERESHKWFNTVKFISSSHTEGHPPFPGSVRPDYHHSGLPYRRLQRKTTPPLLFLLPFAPSHRSSQFVSVHCVYRKLRAALPPGGRAELAQDRPVRRVRRKEVPTTGQSTFSFTLSLSLSPSLWYILAGTRRSPTRRRHAADLPHGQHAPEGFFSTSCQI